MIPHYYFQQNPPPTDWAKWESIGTIAAAFISVVAVIISVITLYLLRKQLEKDQEPFVVVRDDVPLRNNKYRIKLKNVGRGPALDITGCKTADVERRNDAFFAEGQPHSKHFSANNADREKGEEGWKIEKSLVDSLETVQDNNETYKFFYLFYKSQLGDTYRTKVKMKKIGSGFVIMDNERAKC